MMPFSVLRIFGLALFNWVLLGAGIYCGYEAYQELTKPTRFITPSPMGEHLKEDVTSTEVQPIDAPSLNVDAPRERADSEPVRERPRWYGWSMLAIAVLCIGWSVGGATPTTYLLGNSHGATPQPLQPTSTRTIVRPDGTELFTATYGVKSGPTLLLTHGWSLDSSAWDYIQAELVKRYKVVVWDLAGLGKSKAAKSGNQSMQKMAQDLEAVRQETCGSDPVILVGHSIGGMIQQEYCKLFEPHLKSNVKGIVFLHTTYINPVKTNLAAPLTTALQPLLVGLSYLMIPLAPLAWLSNWQSYYNGSMQFTSRLTSFSGKQTREQLNRGALLAAHAWPAVIARGYIAMVNFEGDSVLPRIPVPVLVIAGDHDRLTLPSASDHMVASIPGSKKAPVNSGHLGYWEQADQVRTAVDQFAHATFGSTLKAVV